MKREIEDIQIGPDMKIDGLVRELAGSGVFGAGRLGRAADIVERMVDERCTVFLGLAGAMVPSGMRRLIAGMIQDGMVNVLVSTGANIAHDLMCSFGVKQWRGVRYQTDADLRERGISRIYDSFLEEEAFQIFEEKYGSMLREIIGERSKERIMPSELLREVGLRLSDPNSIVHAAARSDVPLFLPAFADSILGMQTYFVSQTEPLLIDCLGDLGRIIEISYGADEAGAMLIGGGVPKNFILQSKLVAPKGFMYAVQITTDRPDPGGLSGATLDEAVSWGKLEKGSRTATVYGDATILLPVLVAAVRERLADRLPRR